MLTIREDDLSGAAARGLVALHLSGMHASSPPDSVFALDCGGLTAPGVTVWTAWAGTEIAGIGALRQLDGSGGEVKSMRTHPNFLRRGIASALLATIMAEARARRLSRLSLETGRGPAFEPALSLYRRRGFVDGGSFGDYGRMRSAASCISSWTSSRASFGPRLEAPRQVAGKRTGGGHAPIGAGSVRALRAVGVRWPG